MAIQRAIKSNGFTIVEMIVSLAIMGLLAALILPAVQSSRESARRIQCADNLKQFGLALANVAESHGAFPTYPVPESGFWRMLPALEQPALYGELQSINTTPNPQIPKNMTVPQFVCPDDNLHAVGWGNSNYVFNVGTRFRYCLNNGFQKRCEGDTKPSEIVDGLSNTAAMSERLVSVPSFDAPPESVMEKEPRRYFWFTETRYKLKGQELQAVDQCRQHRTTVTPQFAGTYTQLYRDNGINYDHLLTPNEPACYNGPEDFDMGASPFLVPPSSLHPNGVNVLFADGSVHFITDGISDEVWRAVGTRNGQESVSIIF